jgi:hypothetical protein
MRMRPATPEDYAGLVDQVLFEIDALRQAADWDMDSPDSEMPYLDHLETEVRKLRASMADGSYHFGRVDLPFMSMVRKLGEDALPFRRLFYVINATHREGLDTD